MWVLGFDPSRVRDTSETDIEVGGDAATSDRSSNTVAWGRQCSGSYQGFGTISADGESLQFPGVYPSFRKNIRNSPHVVTIIRYVDLGTARTGRMARFPKRVIESGRVTIPADIRQAMEIEEGDTVIVDVQKLPEDLE